MSRLNKTEKEICTLSYLLLRNFLLECANGKKVTGRHVTKACQAIGCIEVINYAGGFEEFAYMLKQLGMNKSSVSIEIKKMKECFSRIHERAKRLAQMENQSSKENAVNNKEDATEKDSKVEEEETKSVFVSIRMTPAEREKLNSWVHPRKRTEYIRACIGLND